MPGLTVPAVAHYAPAPPTKVPLDYADLAIIDLSKAETPEGRLGLATQIREAISTQGFFYVINYGLEKAQAERIFDIADVSFSGVNDDEKRSYEAKIKEAGSYQGYKPRQYWHVDGGVRDQIDSYSVNKDVGKRAHPMPLRPFLQELQEFTQFNHFNVLHPLLRLFALGLGLPEESLVQRHNFDVTGESYLRFMKYYPRSQEDEERSKNVWLKGHTDIGSVTLLYSQPVAALQILLGAPDGTRQWKWVRHIENALVVNAGDSLRFLSGERYSSTIHRVVQPPSDQRQYTRLGVIYFAITDDNVVLKPLPGLSEEEDAKAHADAPTTEEWRKARTAAYGNSALKKGQEVGVEEEVITGKVVKHYS